MNKKNNQKFLGYRNNRKYTENDFFSFLSGLLNGRKNSNFFKIAVERSDFIKRNSTWALPLLNS